MSAYSVTLVPNMPVLHIKINDDYSVGDDMVPSFTAAKELLDTLDEPVYYLNEIGDIGVSFSDLVQLMGNATKGQLDILKHPMIKEIIVVSQHTLLQLGGRALAQKQYGRLTANIFGSVEEAWKYINQEIEKTTR
jgi:hypothetical protein